MTYNWQLPDWPVFPYDRSALEPELFAFAEREGRLGGMMEAMPENQQMEVYLSNLVAEAVKTSEIEGEYLSRQDVMSSVMRQLGAAGPIPASKDKRAQGIAEMMLDVRHTYMEALTDEKLFAWHRQLMMGNKHIEPGRWRRGPEPMQVVAGTVGKETVHFEAPPADRVPREMQAFIKWFNSSAPKGEKDLHNGPVRAALAHLYFESVHPFRDGNGRIGRAIAEKALSQHLGRPVLISISQTIEAHKKTYYRELGHAQRSAEVTPWVKYFLTMLLEAQRQTEELVVFTLKKARFLDKYRNALHERQLKVLRKMLEQGLEGFEGGMNARKYMSLTKVSKATATRDLADLLEMGALEVMGGGRSTGYKIKL